VDANALLPAGVETRAFSVALGDVDGDGDLDAITGGEVVYLNDVGASNRFKVGRYYNPAWGDGFVALGDLDRDGDLDVAFGTGCPEYCGKDHADDGVLWNDGRGQFAAWNLDNGLADTRATAILDVEGDGDLDLVFANLDGNTPSDFLLLNDGTGEFLSAGVPAFPEDFDDGHGLAVGDLDHDGDADLVTFNDVPRYASSRKPSRVYVNLTRHLSLPDLGRLGMPMRLFVDGARDGAAVLVALGPGQTATPFGRLGLDPASLTLFAALGPPLYGRRAELDVAIPRIPSLAGTELWWQAVVLGSAATPRLTNVVADRLTAH
jgi:hypothetical protein